MDIYGLLVTFIIFQVARHTSSFSSRLSNFSTSVPCFSETGIAAESVFFFFDVKMEHAGCANLGLAEIPYNWLKRLILLPNFNDDLINVAIFAVAA